MTIVVSWTKQPMVLLLTSVNLCGVTMLLNRLSFEAAYLITPLALFTMTGLLEDGPEIYNPICHNFDNHRITKKMQ